MHYRNSSVTAAKHFISACKPGYQIEDQALFKKSYSNVASTIKCGELCDQNTNCQSYEYYENEKICTYEIVGAAGASGGDNRKQAKCVKSIEEGLSCLDIKTKLKNSKLNILI